MLNTHFSAHIFLCFEHQRRREGNKVIPPEACAQSQGSLWRQSTVLHWSGRLSNYFGFPYSLSFQQCYFLSSITRVCCSVFSCGGRRLTRRQQLRRNHAFFMGTEDSLPFSRQPASKHYSRLDGCRSYLHTPHFNITHLHPSSKVACSLRLIHAWYSLLSSHLPRFHHVTLSGEEFRS